MPGGEWLLELRYQRLPHLLSTGGVPPWAAFLLFPFLMGFVLVGIKRLIPKANRHHA